MSIVEGIDVLQLVLGDFWRGNAKKLRMPEVVWNGPLGKIFTLVSMVNLQTTAVRRAIAERVPLKGRQTVKLWSSTVALNVRLLPIH